MATREPVNNTLYFGFRCSSLTNEDGDPHFLLLENNLHALIKPFAKLHVKNIIYEFFTWWVKESSTANLLHIVGNIEMIIASQDGNARPAGKVVDFAVDNL